MKLLICLQLFLLLVPKLSSGQFAPYENLTGKSDSEEIEITQQPSSDPVCENAEVTLAVEITSSCGVEYQWYKNEVALEGETSATLNFTATAEDDGARFQVIVIGSCGRISSEEVYLEVRGKAEVASITESMTLCEGTPAGIQIEYKRGREHEWYKNGAPTGIHSNWFEVANPSNGDTYHAVITGYCNTLESSAVTLTVLPNVLITAGPASVEICVGESHTFSVSAQNAIGYQWYFKGELIPGATSGSYTVTNAGPQHVGAYYVKASGNASCGFEASSETVGLSVKPLVGVSNISTEPQPICEGSSVQMQVEDTGGGVLQWYKNGELTSYAGNSITVTDVQNGDKYRAVVTGDCNTAYSDVVTVTVVPNVFITTHPAPANLCAGESHTFSVSAQHATGYQWYFKGELIPGATSGSYTVTNAGPQHEGVYYVKVLGNASCGFEANSETVSLSVKPLVGVSNISTEPQPVCEGASVQLQVEDTGGGTLQWYKNGELTSYIGNSITVTGVQNGDRYQAVVTGDCNTAYSDIVTLTVIPNVFITTHPAPVNLCAGESHTFSVSAQNADGYQWYFKGELIPGATSGNYTVSNAGLEHEGAYSVKVLGNASCGFEANSETVSLSVKPLVGVSNISTEPQPVCDGASVQLQVETTGGGTLQWYKNRELTPYVGNSITVTGVQNGDQYQAMVTGSCNTAYSDVVTLTVLPNVFITTHPAPANLCAGESHTFSVSAQNAVGYQWYFKGELIPGATSGSYTVTNAGPQHEGAYSVKVSGNASCGFEANSEEATLSLKSPVTIDSQTPTVNVNSDQSFELFVVPVGNFSQVLWYRNNTLTAYTGPTIQVNSAAHGDVFFAEVLGDCGPVRSSDIVVNVWDPLKITTTKPLGICKNDYAILAVSGCVEDINWYWGNVNVGNGPVYQASAAGTYTAKCKNGSLLMDSATIEVVDQSVVTYTVSTVDVSCFEGADGSIKIETDGIVQWINHTQLAGNDLSNLSIGTYIFTVTNSAGCEVMDTVFISQPEKVIVNWSVKNLSCFEAHDGEISIDVSSVDPQPVYKLNGIVGQWSNGHITALIAGTYTIEVENNIGCQLLSPTVLTLTEPERLTFSIIESKEPRGHESTDGYMEVEIFGGTAPYSVVWTDGTGNSRASHDYYWGNNLRTQLFNLNKNHYRVNVTDQNQCEATVYYELKAPAPILIASLADSVTCYGYENGRIRLQVEGGVKDGSAIGYQVEWKFEGQVIGSNALQLSGLRAGTYTVQATDANGILAVKTILLGEPGPMSLAVNRLSHNYCSSLAVGEMDLQAGGGKLPYTYFYNDLESASPLLKGLSAGNYSLRVRDSVGCEARAMATIENTQQEFKAHLTYTEPSCYGACDGHISAQVTGGIAPFIYQWSEFSGDSTSLTGVCAGGETYLTVRDANGCEVSSGLLPLSGPAPQILQLPSELEVCPSDFELDASSLQWGRSFVWTFPDGSSLSGAKVKGDSLGIYRVEVLDERSCGGVGQIRVVARKDIHPMFTMPNEAGIHREVVMIDLSEPYPSVIEWVLPPSATRSAQGDFEARAIFSQTGRFVVKQLATIEGCVYTTHKEIRISDAVPDDGFSPPQSFVDIDFKVLGNPVVNGVLNLEINNPAAGSYRVKVFAASGFRKVYEADFTEEKLRNLQISLPEEEAEGLFYVTVETPVYRKTRKILRIK